MLNNIVIRYITSSIISNLKGKKRWLVIIVLAAAYAAQSAGVDLSDFIASLTDILHTAEG